MLLHRQKKQHQALPNFDRPDTSRIRRFSRRTRDGVTVNNVAAQEPPTNVGLGPVISRRFVAANVAHHCTQHGRRKSTALSLFPAHARFGFDTQQHHRSFRSLAQSRPDHRPVSVHTYQPDAPPYAYVSHHDFVQRLERLSQFVFVLNHNIEYS